MDPVLEEISYGSPPRKLLVYKEPNVTSYYQAGESCPSLSKVKPRFTGFATKFINLTPECLALYWEVKCGGKRSLVQSTTPFASASTVSFPGHRFIFVNQKDEVGSPLSWIRPIRSIIMIPITYRMIPNKWKRISPS